MRWCFRSKFSARASKALVQRTGAFSVGNGPLRTFAARRAAACFVLLPRPWSCHRPPLSRRPRNQVLTGSCSHSYRVSLSVIAHGVSRLPPQSRAKVVGEFLDSGRRSAVGTWSGFLSAIFWTLIQPLTRFPGAGSRARKRPARPTSCGSRI